MVLFLLSLATFSSCGILHDYGGSSTPDGYTRLHFAQSGHNPPPSLPGSLTSFALLNQGVYVYLLGVGGTTFSTVFFLPNEADGTPVGDFFVPNGTYRVVGIGYDSFAGSHKCGFGDNGADLALNGTERVINITLNSALCRDGAIVDTTFTDSSTQQFLPVTFVTCNDSTFTAVGGFGSGCSGGSLVNYKIRIINFARTSEGLQELPPFPGASISNCTGATSGLKLPINTPGVQTKHVIRILGWETGTNCDAPIPDVEYFFGMGMGVPNIDSKLIRNGSSTVQPVIFAKIFSNGSATRIFLRNAAP